MVGPRLGLGLVAVVLDNGVGGEVLGIVVGLPAADVGVGVAHLVLCLYSLRIKI